MEFPLFSRDYLMRTRGGSQGHTPAMTDPVVDPVTDPVDEVLQGNWSTACFRSLLFRPI